MGKGKVIIHVSLPHGSPFPRFRAAKISRVFYHLSPPLASTGAARYSGWRFALPADWFYYFYFALGLAETAFQIAYVLGSRREDQLSFLKYDTTRQPVRPAALAALFVLFLILGAAPALSRKLIPQQVFMHSSEENTQQLETILAADPEQTELVSELLSKPGRTVLNGRLLYCIFCYSIYSLFLIIISELY